MADLEDVLCEQKYPGNSSAFSALREQMGAKKVIAFSGAGVSVPDVPTWTGVLRELTREAELGGVLTATDAAEVMKSLGEDPLDAASSIEDAYGKQVFRSKLLTYFDVPDICTTAQVALIKIPFLAQVTLNYDNGLENAFVKQHGKMPESTRSVDAFFSASMDVRREISRRPSPYPSLARGF
ncbi:MAG: hypothetical protein KL863_08955 [Rhizobium sp.]|nr:hypothetical protein [Rhizobium sp.]